MHANERELGRRRGEPAPGVSYPEIPDNCRGRYEMQHYSGRQLLRNA
jgi:hypothetical protein